MNLSAPVKAVLFDLAGTTVDYGSLAPVGAVREVFRSRGVELSSEEARGPMGMAKRDHLLAVAAIPSVAARWGEAHGRPIETADVDAMYSDFLPLQERIIREYSQVIPGVAPAVQRLRQQGVKIGATTGYTRRLLSIVCEQAAEQGFRPDVVLGAEDVPRGRPAPFLIYAAAVQLDVYPLSSIVNVDDTAVGVAAGRNAGCWSVGVSRTGSCVGLSEEEVRMRSPAEIAERVARADERLREAGAHFVVESVAHILPVIHEIERLIACGTHPDSPIA